MARNINFNQLGDLLRNASVKFQNDVKSVVEINLGDMELMAIRLAPGGGDMIKTEYGSEKQEDIARGRSWTPISQAIGYQIDPSGYKGTVFVERSAGEIAAWVEFGTGQSANSYLSTVPTEWRATAAKYIINKKGTIINQPYILPSFMKYKEEFIKDLKIAIKNFGK